jgi:crossover junction endodeoxyribonuclease RuvC
MTETTRILGIDPGSRVTGFGVIEMRGGDYTYIASGSIDTHGDSLAQRLRSLFEGMEDIVNCYSPQVMAVERVFVKHNPESALKLGQARGVAVCAGALKTLSVYEYTPAEIKKALTGKGSATKAQVQHMVKALLRVHGDLRADAADALACALCHSHVYRTRQRIARYGRHAAAGLP